MDKQKQIENLIFNWASKNNRVCDGEAVEQISKMLISSGYGKLEEFANELNQNIHSLDVGVISVDWLTRLIDGMLNDYGIKHGSLTEIVIRGKHYPIKNLPLYIKFYDEHQIKAGQTQCPLCECDYDENGLFVCDECGNLVNKDERCKEHDHGDMTVCQECCDECRRQKALEDAENLKIDRNRGK